MIIADTHNGQLRLQGNETIVDAKDADAAKFRVGSRHVPGESGGGGAYSFDVIEKVEEGSRRVEAAVIVGGSNGFGGEVGICVWNGGPISDANQPKVVELRHNEVEFKVPIKAPNLSGSAIGHILKNGSYELHLQGDRNVVLYDTSTNPWTVVWSLGTQK